MPSRGVRAATMLCALHLWTVFAIALSNAFLALTAIAAFWAGRPGAPSWQRLRPLVLPLCALVGWILVSTLGSTDRATSWDEATELLGLATLPLCLFLIRGREAVGRVIDGLIFMAVLAAIFGLVQGLDTGFTDLQSRIRGPFSHYMTFAGVLLLGNVLLLAQIVYGYRRSWWLAVPLTLLTLGIAVSLTRGVWLALILVAVAMLWVAAPRWLAGLPLLALLFALLMPGFWGHRVASIADLTNESNRERVRMTKAGLRMVEDRPLLGHGPGVLRQIYSRYAEPTALRMNVEHLHNSYLQIAAENGLPALVAFLWLLSSSLRRSVSGLRMSGETDPPVPREVPALFAGALFGLLAFCLAAAFEDNWSDTEVQRMALFLISAPFCLRLPSERAASGS